MRHIFTKEESQLGFRNAVLKVQVEYELDFNQAVQWLMRKISPGGNWVRVRKEKHNGS